MRAWGGDEFAAVLEDVSSTGEASGAAERIAEGPKPPFVLAGYEVSITASIGVALAAPGEVDGVEDLLGDADAAMYRAKARGEAGHEVSVRGARKAPSRPPSGRRRSTYGRSPQ